MTIGIAACGPNAGLAIVRALAAVEKVATGAIGGYAVFAAIDAGGRLHRAETQRGGTTTLFVDGDTTGVMPPPAVAEARSAGLMSSGPDRPAPLAQYVPAEAGVGLVTGHRLPNAAGVSGQPVNQEILIGLRAGLDARTAVDAVLDANPEADAGVIAIDAEGRLYARNSERVARRPDLGHARREIPEAGAVVEVLHNAIFPVAPLAALAAEIAISVMVPRDRIDGWVVAACGVPVVAGGANRVFIDDTGAIQRVETTDHRITRGRHNCAAIYIGAEVVHGDRTLGHTMFEPNVVVEDGRIVSLNGRDSLRIGYRT